MQKNLTYLLALAAVSSTCWLGCKPEPTKPKVESEVIHCDGCFTVSHCLFVNTDGVNNVSNSAHHSIAIGRGASPDESHQLVIAWNDGTETRMPLTNKSWIRGMAALPRDWDSIRLLDTNAP